MGFRGRKLPPSNRPTRIPPGHPWHSRRASETKLVCSRLGLRPRPTEIPRALCTTCDSGYPYLVSIPADSLDVRGASEFVTPSWPRLGVHQLGEMMMRLTGGWEGKEVLADFIVYSPVLQSPRKKKKKKKRPLSVVFNFDGSLCLFVFPSSSSFLSHCSQ